MLRIKHKGGEKVSKGNYWNITNGKRVIVRRKRKRFPAMIRQTYYKAKSIIVLMVSGTGPSDFCMQLFWPFIGIAMVMQLLLTKMFCRDFW